MFGIRKLIEEGYDMIDLIDDRYYESYSYGLTTDDDERSNNGVIVYNDIITFDKEHNEIEIGYDGNDVVIPARLAIAIGRRAKELGMDHERRLSEIRLINRLGTQMFEELGYEKIELKAFMPRKVIETDFVRMNQDGSMTKISFSNIDHEWDYEIYKDGDIVSEVPTEEERDAIYRFREEVW